MKTEATTNKAKEAQREYMRQWRAAHREATRAYNKKWRQANPDKVREYQSRYWEKVADRDLELLDNSVKQEQA